MVNRYYVDDSSWFDSHPYDKRKIKAAVGRAGGTNIRESQKFGWRNQPKVITFDLPPVPRGQLARHVVDRVAHEVGKALNTQWIIVMKKDW